MNVLVTGSSRGIGPAIAKEFDWPGNVLFINGRDAGRLSAVVPLFGGAETVPIIADVGSYSDAAAAFEIIDSRGGLDVLVNNAGAAYRGLLQDMTGGEIDDILNVNLKSVINFSRLALPAMIRRGSGVIVNVSSIWGVSGASCEAVYSAAKGGVNAFTKALAKEVAPCGVRVNAVACGVIDTEMNAFLSGGERRELEDEIPLGRFGKTGEIAAVVKFLSSGAAGYLTGQVIVADGGLI